ncbi:MAG: hypothetical protein IJG15_01545, partial [Lachnospiraceae bacterium]|nr:hypothetical protein [Lachnospiraceae bacterium]
IVDWRDHFLHNIYEHTYPQFVDNLIRLKFSSFYYIFVSVVICVKKVSVSRHFYFLTGFLRPWRREIMAGHILLTETDPMKSPFQCGYPQ